LTLNTIRFSFPIIIKTQPTFIYNKVDNLIVFVLAVEKHLPVAEPMISDCPTSNILPFGTLSKNLLPCPPFISPLFKRSTQSTKLSGH